MLLPVVAVVVVITHPLLPGVPAVLAAVRQEARAVPQEVPPAVVAARTLPVVQEEQAVKIMVRLVPRRQVEQEQMEKVTQATTVKALKIMVVPLMAVMEVKEMRQEVDLPEAAAAVLPITAAEAAALLFLLMPVAVVVAEVRPTP